MWGVGDGLFFYIRPLYLTELGADPVAIGSILALAFLATAVTHIPAGYLADHFGRKRLLVAGWALGTVAGLIMFLARDLRLFVFGLVGYMFTGFVQGPINAYAAEARGTQSVQRALTLISASYWAGSIFSPAVGGLIGRAYGLRTVFGVAVLAFALSTLAVMPLQPQPLAPPTGGRTRYGPLFRNRRFLGFLGLIFLAFGAMQLGMPFLPNFVVEARGFDVGVVGALGSVNSMGAMLLSLVLGQRQPRRGLMLGQAFMALSLILLLATTRVGWIGLACFCQAGWNLARNMAASQVRHVVETPELGLAFGLTETVASATLILATLAAGVLYTAHRALPFQVSLVLVGLTLPLVARFAPRRDTPAAEALLVGNP